MDIFTDNIHLETIEFGENQISAQKKQDINTFLEVNRRKNCIKIPYR